MDPGTALVHSENQAEDNTQDDSLVGSESLHSKQKCSDAGMQFIEENCKDGGTFEGGFSDQNGLDTRTDNERTRGSKIEEKERYLENEAMRAFWTHPFLSQHEGTKIICSKPAEPDYISVDVEWLVDHGVPENIALLFLDNPPGHWTDSTDDRTNSNSNYST
eukprot:gene11088-12921_t